MGYCLVTNDNSFYNEKTKTIRLSNNKSEVSNSAEPVSAGKGHGHLLASYLVQC